jgi:ring-1,2-phenylacetyl-CoA epoxidase subunit PaaC
MTTAEPPTTGGPVTTGDPATTAPPTPQASGRFGGALSASPINQDLDPETREALADLLLAMADDEFVLGFWDSEWTGIAPVLEEDVAFASLAQDEVGHAQALYRLLADLAGGDPDRIAFGRQPEAYRHARLLDHARTDWAFSIARRFLYDTADAARLDALVASAYRPLAGVVAKMRREETYHLLHVHAWLERLAQGGDEPRARLVAALERLWPDALTVLSGVPDELLVAAGILAEPLAEVEQRWLAGLAPLFARLQLPFPFRQAGGRLEPTVQRPAAGRGGERGDDFRWLWGEFTMVYRSDPEATW